MTPMPLTVKQRAKTNGVLSFVYVFRCPRLTTVPAGPEREGMMQESAPLYYQLQAGTSEQYSADADDAGKLHHPVLKVDR